MDDVISRQAVLDAFEGELYSLSLFEKIQNLPSAQPDCKPGYWIFKEGETAFWDVCSKCGKKTIYRMPHFNYCPYCGSRMEGE